MESMTNNFKYFVRESTSVCRREPVESVHLPDSVNHRMCVCVCEPALTCIVLRLGKYVCIVGIIIKSGTDMIKIN